MSTSNYGSKFGKPEDWTAIIGSAGEGTKSAFEGAAGRANSKIEAKEAKRKTLSNLLNGALKRNQGLFRVGQEHANDMNDFQSQALQQIARGFVNALK